LPTLAVVTAGAVLASSTLPIGLARAQQQAEQKAYVMKISTPTIHDIPDKWAANFASAVEKDSGGRIKVQLYPASQLGSIPRQIEGTQFGSIQMEVVPPEFMVGLDPRFEVLAAPGLLESQAHGQRVAADSAVLKLMLGLGADKGLHGVGLFMAEQSVMVTRMPLRHLADFKGKKIRIFASQFQSEAFARLGITPVAMTLGDVLPAIQQGAIDGAVTGIGPVANFHMVDAAKFVTQTGQPAIFLIAVVNKKMVRIAAEGFAGHHRQGSRGAVAFTSKGGELITLPPAEHARMMKTILSVGPDVSSKNPTLAAAYKILAGAFTVQKRLLGGCRIAAKRKVAVGKSPKSLNNLSMLLCVAQLLGITQRFIQAHRAVLVAQDFRMHEGQIEELPHCWACRLIKAARQRAIGDSARQRIGREGARGATKHVARKLIEQQEKRQRALCVVFPTRKPAICGDLVGRDKPRSDGLVEAFVPLEPFVGSGFAPEGNDLRGRNRNSH
jgi:TRAP-type C4-dicarboxylate transport system substrate-binding protein